MAECGSSRGARHRHSGGIAATGKRGPGGRDQQKLRGPHSGVSLDEFLVTRETMLQHIDPEVANGFMETVAAENNALVPMARMFRRSSLQPEVLQGLRARW